MGISVVVSSTIVATTMYITRRYTARDRSNVWPGNQLRPLDNKSEGFREVSVALSVRLVRAVFSETDNIMTIRVNFARNLRKLVALR